MDRGAYPPFQSDGGDIRRRLAEMSHYRMTGQWDRLKEHLAPNIVVRGNYSKYPEHPHDLIFGPDQIEGRNAFCAKMRRVDEEFQPLDREILDVLVEGDRAAARWRGRWRHRGTGAVYSLNMAHFMRWRNGRVVELFEFLDVPGAPGHGDGRLPSFEAMLNPPPAGLTREEMVARIYALADYPSPNGPDFALMRRYYASDIVCEFGGDRARIPYSGRHVGVEAAISIVRAVGIDFEQLGFSLSDVVVDGSRLACRRTVEWRHRGTGRRGVVELVQFMKFEYGLIVELIEYRDSLTILEMQGEAEA
jgi:ketosteroid isomerase-like protein